MNPTKRFASHFLYLSSKIVYKQYVVEMDGRQVVRIFPLIEEISSTQWVGGVIVLSELYVERLSGLFQYSLNEMIEHLSGNILIDTKGNVLNVPAYAYHINSLDYDKMTDLSQTKIIRL